MFSTPLGGYRLGTNVTIFTSKGFFNEESDCQNDFRQQRVDIATQPNRSADQTQTAEHFV